MQQSHTILWRNHRPLVRDISYEMRQTYNAAVSKRLLKSNYGSQTNEALLATSTPLQESRLSLENLQGFLQSLNLCFPARFAFCICLRLCNAALSELSIILEDSVQLGLGGVPVAAHIG